MNANEAKHQARVAECAVRGGAMLSDFTGAAHIYIACGYTDLRRGIDGLAWIVEREFRLDPFSDSLFLFCGRRKDRIKALYWGAKRSAISCA